MITENPTPINRILDTEQTKALLEMVFAGRPITILRAIARTGKYRQSVPWVYWECELTGMRRATFVSLQDLAIAFWEWLQTIEVMMLALWQQKAVSMVAWVLVAIGDMVYHRDNGWCTVVDKELTVGKQLPQLWLEASEAIIKCSPLEVSII